jgi:hypothetical protein
MKGNRGSIKQFVFIAAAALAFSMCAQTGAVLAADSRSLAVTHRTSAAVVDGASDYGLSEQYKPRVRRLDFSPEQVPLRMIGKLHLYSDGVSVLAVVRDGKTEMDELSGDIEAPLWFDADLGQYYVGDGSRERCYFVESYETALSGQDFSMYVGATVTPGILPKIISTKIQLEEKKCVPRLDLIKDGGNLTGVSLRFVDPGNSSVALRKDEKRNIKSVIRLEVFDFDQKVIASEPVDYEPNTGDNIQTSVVFERPIKTNHIYYISVYFDFDEPEGTNSSVDYAWDNLLVWRAAEDGGEDDGSSGKPDVGGCSGGYFGFFAFMALVFLVYAKTRCERR